MATYRPHGENSMAIGRSSSGTSNGSPKFRRRRKSDARIFAAGREPTPVRRNICRYYATIVAKESSPGGRGHCGIASDPPGLHFSICQACHKDTLGG